MDSNCQALECFWTKCLIQTSLSANYFAISEPKNLISFAVKHRNYEIPHDAVLECSLLVFCSSQQNNHSSLHPSEAYALSGKKAQLSSIPRFPQSFVWSVKHIWYFCHFHFYGQCCRYRTSLSVRSSLCTHLFLSFSLFSLFFYVKVAKHKYQKSLGIHIKDRVFVQQAEE